MQITIHDHDMSVSSKRDKFRWNVMFTVEQEDKFGFSRMLCLDFADFASYLVACGDFDAYDDCHDDGALFTFENRLCTGGTATFYTFDEVVRELMPDLENRLREFIKLRLIESEAITAA